MCCGLHEGPPPRKFGPNFSHSLLRNETIFVTLSVLDVERLRTHLGRGETSLRIAAGVHPCLLHCFPFCFCVIELLVKEMMVMINIETLF